MTEGAKAGMMERGRILIVDDDPGIRRVLLQALRDHGWHAGEAEDGLQALARLQHGAFDVIVTDFQMPRLDGLALLRQVRRMDRPLSVVVHSAQTDAPTHAQLRRAGAFRILTKGCDFADLVKSVEEAYRVFERPPARCA